MNWPLSYRFGRMWGYAGLPCEPPEDLILPARADWIKGWEEGLAERGNR